MKEPLDEQYLTWLYSRIGSTKVTNPTRTYWSLFKQLYQKEFVWLVPNDDNRVEDGRDLRYAFLEEAGLKHVDPNWMGLGCSVLEMLIALSERMAFEADGQARTWFWHLLDNIGLGGYTDAKQDCAEDIEDVVDRVIWRNYEPDGRGGLFPLENPASDQREVEIWYQLCAYLLERD